MMADFELPSITAPDEAGQLMQVKEYLFGLTEKLNFAFNAIEKAENGDTSAVATAGENPVAKKDKEALDRFNEIKSLIVKSGEVVSSLYQQISIRMQGVYVTESDFGSYIDAQGNEITVTSSDLKSSLQRLEVITDTLQNVTNTMITNANIRAGFLGTDEETGIDMVGIELGQRTELDGEEIFNKFARFTPQGIYFYGSNGTYPIAYMTGQRLTITEAYISDSMYLGGYVCDFSNGGLAFRWAGEE